MKEGDVLLAPLLQRDGTLKDRPVLFLRRMPPFEDFLVCGISTQLQQAVSSKDGSGASQQPDANACSPD